MTGPSPSLPDLVDDWISDRRVRSRRGLSSNSERAYRSDLAGFARRAATRPPALEVDPDDPWGRQNLQLARVGLEAFTDETLAGVFGQMIDEGAAETSRGRMLSALRGFCRWLQKQGHLDTDPTRDFETPQTPERLRLALTDQQLAGVVKAAADPEGRLHSHWAARDVAIIGLLAGCGLRSAELITLRLDHIQRAEPQRITVTGKGDKQRTLPLSPEVLASIDNYLTERTQQHDNQPDPHDPVFVRVNGTPLNNQALQNLVTNWLAAATIAPPPGEKAHLYDPCT